MTLKLGIGRKMLFIFHSLGLSCLGGAIFLQILVFADIMNKGYFIAAENNSIILTLEVGLTAFASLYFIYIYQRLMRSIN